MDIENEIDRVVETSRAADVDAQTTIPDASEDPRQDNRSTAALPPTASMMAIALGDLFRNYADFRGFISISHSMGGQVQAVFVTEEYFDANYTDNIETEEIPAHGAIECSVELDGAKVYCWKKAEYKVVRV